MPRGPRSGRICTPVKAACAPPSRVEDVAGLVRHHLVAAPAMGEDGDDVAHGARGQEHRRFLAQQRRHAVAERVDGRVVAVLLVADLGAHHGVLHRRRRAGLGVGVEVDPHRRRVLRRAKRGVDHGGRVPRRFGGRRAWWQRAAAGASRRARARAPVLASAAASRRGRIALRIRRRRAMATVRKVVVLRERVFGELGEAAARPVTRVAALAVVANPFAGRFVADLRPAVAARGEARRATDAGAGGDCWARRPSPTARAPSSG